MAAYPTIGGSDGSWGTEKKAWDLIGHNDDGTNKGLPYIKLVDSKADGVDGGTFTLGAWRKRTVTEETDTGSDCAVAASVIVLTAGTYRCSISCPAHMVAKHQARLYNTTGAATLLLGTSERAYSGAASSSNRSYIVGQFVVAATQSLEIQHYCSGTRATEGLGYACDTGAGEIYTIAEFWRIS